MSLFRKYGRMVEDGASAQEKTVKRPKVIRTRFNIPFRLNRWIVRHADAWGAWASFITVIGLPILLFGGLHTYLQVINYFVRPDVELSIQNPLDPRFYLINPTTVVVREGVAQVSLIDVEHPGDSRAGIFTVGISVRPKDGTRLLGINLDNVMGKIAFGWAMISCPDCKNRRYYWILVKRGENAWFSEIHPDEVPSIEENLRAVTTAGADNLGMLDKIMPTNRRIQASSATLP